MAAGANPEDVAGPTVRLRTLGCVVEVQFPPGTSSVEPFRRLWSRALAPDVGADTTVVAPDGADADVQHALSMSVTLAAIEAQIGDLWMLHAAGLADPNTGAVVALVAPSGTGKSTAASVLGRRWAYLSDETVGVDRSGKVKAHPKPLSRVVPDTGVKLQIGPDEAGLVALGAPPWLAVIVLLDRDGTADPVVEPVRPAEAIALLAAQTSFLGRLPRPLHFLSDVLATTSGVWAVRYAEVATLEPVIASLLTSPKVVSLVEAPRPAYQDTAPVVEPSPVVEPPQVVEPPPVVELVETLRVLAHPFIDALDLDDERLVLVGERVVLLSPVASVVHRLLPIDRPIGLRHLLDRIAAELPLPPDPEQALLTLLEEMAAESLVAVAT